MFALIAACGGSHDGAATGVVSIVTVTRTAPATQSPGSNAPTTTAVATAVATATFAADTPTVEPAAPSPTTDVEPTTPPSQPANTDSDLTGFIYPIAGACLPQGDQLMPNAPRDYRQGTHEGVDFYQVDDCTAIGLGTPVMAAKAGRVIRVDRDYVDPTGAEMNALLANPNAPGALDQFRGRQIWIDHGNGIVTRYCHLSGIAGDLQVNDEVTQGEVIGYVGESGTPGSISAPGTELHLHWEVRVGDSYLGAGLPPSQVRALYLGLFSP